MTLATLNSRLPVLTKTDFVRRYKLGEFGNHSPTWDSVEEALPEIREKDLEIRYHLRNRVAGGITEYDVPGWCVDDEYVSMLSKGVKASDIYVSAMCPTEKTMIQGEVMRTPTGTYLYYSHIRKPMRDALREQSIEARGLKATMLLRWYMDIPSYDWLDYLLEAYPDHVVEFTTLSVKWGTHPGYNTLFWEVRKGY